MTLGNRRSFVLVLFAGVLVALFVVGCSSSSNKRSDTTGPFPSAASNTTTPASGVGSGTVAPAAAAAVVIRDFAFSPATVQVKVGQKVTFTNRDDTTHTATAADKSFDTGDLDSGASKTVTFAKPGTVHYVCSIHPSMNGTIEVTS